MSDQANMSPNASPGALGKAGNRRVNNMPLLIVGVIVLTFLLVMVFVGFQRAAKQNAPTKPEKAKGGTTGMTFAKALTTDQLTGIIPPRAANPASGGMSASALAPAGASAVAIARPENLDAPPMPPGRLNPLFSYVVTPPPPPRDEAMAERIRQAKEQQFMEAVKASPVVNYEAPRSAGSTVSGFAGVPTNTPKTRDDILARIEAVRSQIQTSNNADPTTTYKQKLAELETSGFVLSGRGEAAGASAAPSLVSVSTASVNRRDSMQLGAATRGRGHYTLDAQPEAPATPFTVRAPSVIPATLISGINSELKGPIFAQVSQNVYDTATGKHLVIPQGSKLYGEYDSQVAFGQSRILIAWERIVFPDGKAMEIGSMPGADSAGYAGFNDQVNNHYVRLFASAIMLSAVTAGVSLSTDRNQTASIYGTQQTTSGALNQALGQQLGQTTAQLLQKNMNIAPTLEIRPGYRFKVIVTKDMNFSKPYQAFDY